VELEEVMAGLAATTTTVQTVTLKPTVRKKLLTELRTYLGLKEQDAAIDVAKKKCRGNIGAILEDVGESTLKIEGFTATFVAPAKRVLDRKKFVQLGGDLALLDAAYVEQAVTPYVKVTTPSEKEDKE
jgi:hypothetical protein